MAVLKDLIVHGASRFINGIQAEDIQAEDIQTTRLTVDNITADSGYFNYLKAVEGDVTNLTTEELLATNATVVGLLDVQGEMHTNSWTNANIANIGGSFYIAPTIETASNFVTIVYTIPTDETITPYYTISVSGAAMSMSDGNVVTGGVQWKTSSKVMITGSIDIDNTTYPLGTCVGELTAIGSDSFTVSNIYNTSSDIPGNSILDGSLHALVEKFGTSITATSKNLKISMYEIEGTKPVGIMMTSYGYDKATYIDIYGGVNVKQDGLVDPNVRIGYLGDGKTPYGLEEFNDSNQPYPQGWGIYTDNGYFKGTIIAESGRIGNGTTAWAIGNEDERAFIYSGVSEINSVATEGMYVGTDGILNVSSGNTPQYYTQITNGILTAQGAKLQDVIIYDTEGNKHVEVNEEGMSIFDGNGENTTIELASFKVRNGSSIITIGDKTQLHIEITNNELGFYSNEESTSKVVYIKSDEMFIQKSIVAQSLDVGLRSNQTDPMTNKSGKGQWSWQVHEVNGANNLSLKWLD